jgi:type VI secretion system protein ImpJ
MFLQPQHFQQQELHLEAREFARFQALNPFCWGVIGAQFDESQLANFTLVAQALRLVFPDGTLVDVPGNARVPARGFEELLTQAGGRLEVRVGVRHLEVQRAQAGTDMDDRRYVISPDEVEDLDSGQSKTPVEKLEYNLRFFFGEEPAHGFETLPIARLERMGDPARPVRVDPAFAPPSLLLAASRPLHEAARGVAAMLQRTLDEREHDRMGENARDLMLYQALSGALPVLREMNRDGIVHPRRVYLELARVAGALLFRDARQRTVEEAVPGYSHREPAPVFSALLQLIGELCEHHVRERWIRREMERDGEVFSVTLPDEAKAAGARCFLEVLADASAPKVPGLLKHAKISNPERVSFLVTRALPGVPTEPMAGQPAELPPGQTGSYFRLKQESDEWNVQVLVSDRLAVQMRGADPDVRANLVVVLPGQGG